MAAADEEEVLWTEEAGMASAGDEEEEEVVWATKVPAETDDEVMEGEGITGAGAE